MQIYRHPLPFRLESGEMLEGLEIAYHTWGDPSCAARSTVWVCHALTANSDVADWWPGTVEPGRFLDPARNFVVCANILGSCYGTTGPLSPDPRTGRGRFRAFPRLTMRDVVAAHRLLASHLGIGPIKALIGSSVGGFQAVEWAVEEPQRIKRLVLIATSSKASPWAIAVDETQRMAIEADPTYALDTPEGGLAGLEAARAIGLLTYRGAKGYNLTQGNHDPAADEALFPAHRACSYQRHQGEKLRRRFDAYSYMAILDSFDTHNVGRGRGGVKKALAAVTARTVVVGISSDIIFPPDEVRQLAADIPGATYIEIDSPFGHDGFLVEADKLDAAINRFINAPLSADEILPDDNQWTITRK